MLYITGTGCISPQRTFDNSVFLPEVKTYTVNRMACIDADDYTKFFDAGSIRRMGRLMKYGTAAGLIALNDAGVKVPGAITTGTGLGLPEISQKFLRSLIEAGETIVSPTAFIQSTHNTVSSNIALLCGCYAHNNTFSHKGFSFESALADAFLLATEGIDNILVGAYDEVSDYKYAAMRKTTELRTEPCTSVELYTDRRGIIAGEGAAFFVLGKHKTDNTYGQLLGNKIFYKPASADVALENISVLLAAHDLTISGVDVLLTGMNGHAVDDAFTQQVADVFEASTTIAAYKHLCGEYMTSSAFATWVASQMMKTQTIPDTLVLRKGDRAPKTILLYTHHRHNHSLVLFKAC
jgi:3-oxoacyl-(acyl-carrier-protein) synthase